MATRKTAPKSDERKGMQRYVDQPGQWVDTTPASLKAQQQKGINDLLRSMSPAKRRSIENAAKKFRK